MATKYRVILNGDKEPIGERAKKNAAIALGEKRGGDFKVVTDSGTVVHEHTEAPSEPVEEAQAEASAEQPVAPENAEEDVLYYESMQFPGNYSIVTAPGAVLIAEAAGVPAKVQNHGMALTRTVHFGGPDMDLAQKVVAVVKEETAAALAHLKQWQKDNIERRRGLTDQQRYLEHREVLSKHYAKVARTIKKNGLV